MEGLPKKYNYFFRQLLFLGLIIGIGIIIWDHLGSLLSSFLGAFTAYVVLRKPLFHLTGKRKWKPGLASLLLVFVAILFLLGAGFLIFEIVASEIPAINTTVIVEQFNHVVNIVNDYFGYALISKKLLFESRELIANVGTNLVSALFNTTYSVVINSLLMVFILYFMLANARKLEEKMERYSPFQGNSLQLLRSEIKNMVYGNAVGIPLIMLVQGITAGIGYWIFGVDKVFFWAFLTAITGLIPLVGTGVVWLPLGIYLLATGNVWQGIGLILYGVIVISSADNVARMVLMKSTADVHPLVVIFGVILGIPLFGFWGIIFGPLLISGFLLLIRIYFMEYHNNAIK